MEIFDDSAASIREVSIVDGIYVHKKLLNTLANPFGNSSAV